MVRLEFRCGTCKQVFPREFPDGFEKARAALFMCAACSVDKRGPDPWLLHGYKNATHAKNAKRKTKTLCEVFGRYTTVGHNEYFKEYRKAYPHKIKEFVHRARARKHNAPTNFTWQGWMWRVEYHGWKCVYCGIPLNEKTLVCDHYKPLIKGGTDFLANLYPSCRFCNSQKHANLRWTFLRNRVQ